MILASIWPILAAVFIVSVLVKLVYKLHLERQNSPPPHILSPAAILTSALVDTSSEEEEELKEAEEEEDEKEKVNEDKAKEDEAEVEEEDEEVKELCSYPSLLRWSGNTSFGRSGRSEKRGRGPRQQLVGRARRSNYFDRRYTSRRPLSAVLIDDQFEELSSSVLSAASTPTLDSDEELYKQLARLL